MKEIKLQTLSSKKSKFCAFIRDEAIEIVTGNSHSAQKFTASQISDCLEHFSHHDGFFLGNTIDKVKEGGLGEYFKDVLNISPRYASHFAAVMIRIGKFEYYGKAKRPLRFSVKDTQFKGCADTLGIVDSVKSERPINKPDFNTFEKRNRSFKLRFNIQEIPFWAERYEYGDSIPIEIGEKVKDRGYLTREDFLRLCYWKAKRTKPTCERNDSLIIKEVTERALSEADDRKRINLLRSLHGVEKPTASVILHFCHNDDYPILDFRALWSIGVDRKVSYYSFSLWWDYTVYCRNLASEAGVDMRTLDRALWQYSKEKQR